MVNQLRAFLNHNLRIVSVLSEHRHFVIIISLLILVMTFPTIVYVFKTDAFYLSTGDSYDIFIHIWDVWYWKQILFGLADRSFTNIMFYPEGLSLVHHPFSSMPMNTLQIALQQFMPVSNAFNVAFLLVVYLNAIAAYVYALWLFKDKWIALFCACVFAISPHALGQPNQLHDATIATVPLALYCFHRGITEGRSRLIIAAGLVAGLSSTITLYNFSCLLISLAAFAVAFAIGRWRDMRYWLHMGLLALTIAATSIWIIYPMLTDANALDTALEWHDKEFRNDLISSFVNHNNPIIGPALESLFQTPAILHWSATSYIGFLPALLIVLGFISRATRRKMLPWLALASLFFILRLGSTLHINGVVYPDIPLPKHYLNEILPSVFKAFVETHRFQIGFLLPFALLAGYGYIALKSLRPSAARPWVIALLIAVLALEYYVPLMEKSIPFARFAYMDWLEQEEDFEIRLIHLPLGRINSKQYMLFQSLSGYPHAEGAISRTPEKAYNYIKANPVLSVWNNLQPTNCIIQNQDEYLAGVQQLVDDGFSHIVHHRDRYYWERQIESFRYVDPAYSDEYVSIYRLSDLRDSCPRDFLERHPTARAFVDALRQPSVIDSRPGKVVLFPPSPEHADDIRKHIRRFSPIDQAVVTIAIDEGGSVVARSSENLDADASYNLESDAAIWLVSNVAEFNAEQTSAYQSWFAPRFKFCARYQEDESHSIDLFVRADIPCSAMDGGSALEIQYDAGVRLRNASFEAASDALRFYLAWTNNTNDEYAFSLQFFDDGGNKALQYDNVIGRDLLTVHDIDTRQLADGAYFVKLIVYNFETRVRQSGTIIDTGERFEREFEIARIEV